MPEGSQEVQRVTLDVETSSPTINSLKELKPSDRAALVAQLIASPDSGCVDAQNRLKVSLLEACRAVIEDSVSSPEVASLRRLLANNGYFREGGGRYGRLVAEPGVSDATHRKQPTVRRPRKSAKRPAAAKRAAAEPASNAGDDLAGEFAQSFAACVAHVQQEIDTARQLGQELVRTFPDPAAALRVLGMVNDSVKAWAANQVAAQG